MKEFDLANYPPQRITVDPWYDDYARNQHQTNMCMIGFHLPVIEQDIREFQSMLYRMPFRMVGQEKITCSHCEAYLDRAYTCYAGLHAYRRIEQPTQWVSTGGSAYPIRFPDKHVCEFCGDTKNE